MDRDGYLAAWAHHHGGYDPMRNPLVRGWLSGTYVVARPLADRHVPPDALTAAGVAASAAAALLAALDARGWLLGAALVVVGSALLDSLDGAVALLTGRATRWGYVLDSVCDRVGVLLHLLALWLAGAHPAMCVAGGSLMLLQEYTRARAGSAGMTEVGVVTVGERPTRVVVTAAFLAATAVLGQPWATLGAAAWVGLGAVGLAQLLVVTRRRLR